jgi:hypothetical protein
VTTIVPPSLIFPRSDDRPFRSDGDLYFEVARLQGRLRVLSLAHEHAAEAWIELASALTLRLELLEHRLAQLEKARGCDARALEAAEREL